MQGQFKGSTRMEVRCDKCQARYRVADEKIGPQGLTMKCGKCANQFRVTRDPAPAAVAATVLDQAPVPPRPAAKPAAAPKRPEPESSATMVFGQAPVAPARPSAAMPSAAKPAPAATPGVKAPAAKTPATKPAAPAAASPADEGAGRTMMFQTGNLKAPPPAKAAPKAPGAEARAAESDSGSTMVFGQSPLAKPATAMPKAAPARPPAAKPGESESGATMVFGQSPVAPARPAPKPAATKPAAAKPAASDDAAGSTMMLGAAPELPTRLSAPVPKAQAAAAPPPPQPEPEAAPEPEAEPTEEQDSEAPTEIGEGVDSDLGEAAAPPAGSEHKTDRSRADLSEAPSEEGGVRADGMESQDEATAVEGAEGTFDKAPPRGLLIGIAAGVAALVLILVALVAVKKLGHHPASPAAIEALAAAQAAADKDSLASLADAEAKAKDAIEQAGAKSHFPQGPAQLAQIDVQWADALADQAALLTTKGQGEGDEAKKTVGEQKIADLMTQAKGKLKAAFDTLSLAIKADPKSPDLELALAEYYRAQRSGSNMNKELKKAQALKADEARVALVQGESLAQEEDGGEKALPKLKTALAAAPQSARIHFRLAMANLSMHNNDEALKELKETLRLSPQHERARLAMEQLATTTEQK